MNALSSKGRADNVCLFKVLEQLDPGTRFSHCVIIRFVTPDKLLPSTKAFVPPSKGSVDHVLSVATDSYETAVGTMLKRLRIKVATPQLLDRESESFTVHNFFASKLFQIHRLNLVVLRPDYLPTWIHTGHWFFPTNLDHHSTLIIPDGKEVRTDLRGYRPDSFQPMVQCVLQAISCGVPDTYGTIFAASDDDGQVRMERNGRHIVGMPSQGLHACFGLIVPNLHQLIVCSRDEVWSISSGEVIDAVDSLFVALQGKVRHGLSKAPDLDRSIKRSRSKRIRVFRIEDNLHDVMAVSFEYLGACPSFVPIPKLDGHVIAGRQYAWQRGMDRHAPYVVGMGFEGLHFVQGVVVEDPDEHIVRSSDNPLFSCDELGRSHG
mmetsp:Transcript_8943/g.54996  ORF Transcript_8943/g.54996 Transcript_8943/m.54996 type:complete len:377 (-) Transcript_8943:300-1430(-)